MYIIEISYTAPLDEIDAALDAHRTWLDTQYAAQHFLASGRQEPRVGGIIITADLPRRDLEELVKTDPFALRHLADHRVIEFRPSRMASANTWHLD